MSTVISSFGLALRQLRIQRGWSQELLAGRAELNRSYVGEIERGEVVVSLLTLEKLALALGISMTTLLGHGERIEQTRTLRGIALTAIAC